MYAFLISFRIIEGVGLQLKLTLFDSKIIKQIKQWLI